jgi:hypothetical protein
MRVDAAPRNEAYDAGLDSGSDRTGGIELKHSRVVSIRQVSEASGTGQAAAAEPRASAVDFGEILRSLGTAALAGDAAGALVFTPASERLMRQLAARYGFERLPASYAELFGLIEYCDSLDAASGVGMRPKDQLAEWQAASFEVWRRKNPGLMPAIERYCAGDIDGLRALHLRQDTLTALGRNHVEAGP